MHKVERSELLDLGAYEQLREHFRARMMAVKARRRIGLGPHMTLLFENHDTVLQQVQEMLRTERITDERAITHELQTYNELIPPLRALCATLFIEYDDPAERRVMLGKLATLRSELRLRVGAEDHVARFATHFGEELDRLPAVNYLTFSVAAETRASLLDAAVPACLAATHPDYAATAELPVALRQELADDLAE